MCSKETHGASSSNVFVHPRSQKGQVIKDHPLDKVIGDVTAPLKTRKQSRFISANAQTLYLSRFQTQGVVPERIVLYNELDTLEFAVWMQQRWRFTLYDLGYQIVVNWVREFYAKMHEVSATSFKSFVRGEVFEISLDSLSAILEIPRTEGAMCQVVDDWQINYNEVARELTGKPINWVGGSLNQNKLIESYRLLNIFIRHNVNTKGSKAIPKDNGYLLYCIGTGKTVDLPLVVLRGMTKMQSASLNALLPFPGLISKMFVDLGKVAEHTEDIIIPTQKIDKFTLDESKSHLKATDLEDDDSDDDADLEGDQAAPSGVAPSGAGPSSVGPSTAGPAHEQPQGEGSFELSMIVSSVWRCVWMKASKKCVSSSMISWMFCGNTRSSFQLL
ncbi:hypothetical protein MRB53_023760 [Persea americana]|uniref:Uncharacterized protein n=1 Tax=Persea americana TaxID=3435 RepID=A0ACC2LBG3_PERAE|nr:hypothetical protein MRB53_023760 [Persea americana]